MPIRTAPVTPISIALNSPRFAKRLREAPSEVDWTATGIGVQSAYENGTLLGTIEESPEYGFVLRDADRAWMGSFSMLSDAMWFLPLAVRAAAA